MSTFRLLFVPLALVAVTAPARAQHRGGAASAPSTQRAAAQEQRGAREWRHSSPDAGTSGGAWTGQASKWGGSPPERFVQPFSPFAIPVPFVLDGAALPAAAPAVAPTVVPGGVFVEPQPAALDPGAVQMQVIERHPPREMTTMDVYREQRFRKP